MVDTATRWKWPSLATVVVTAWRGTEHRRVEADLHVGQVVESEGNRVESSVIPPVPQFSLRLQIPGLKETGATATATNHSKSSTASKFRAFKYPSPSLSAAQTQLQKSPNITSEGSIKKERSIKKGRRWPQSATASPMPRARSARRRGSCRRPRCRLRTRTRASWCCSTSYDDGSTDSPPGCSPPTSSTESTSTATTRRICCGAIRRRHRPTASVPPTS